MSSPRAIVILSSVTWHATWQRHHALARAAAQRGHRVVFVEPHPRAAMQIVRHAGQSIRTRRHPAAHQPCPAGISVLHWHVDDLSWPHTHQRIVDAAGGAIAATILYVPAGRDLALAQALRALIVYDKVLDWSAVPGTWYAPAGWRDVERSLEQAAAAGAARLTTDSRRILADWTRRGIPGAHVPPAADPEFLDHAWAPAPAGPVGYFGAVRREEIDVELMIRLAESNRIEVVGPCDAPTAQRLAEAGIRLHGARPIAEVPALVDRWSAVLLPYRVTARTRTMVPAKLWNALVTGRPVLASGLDLDDDDFRRIESIIVDERGRLVIPPAAPSPAAPPGWDDRLADMLGQHAEAHAGEASP